MNFIRKYPNLSTVLFGIVLCISLILFVELSLRIVGRFTKNNERLLDRHHARGYFYRDEFDLSKANEGKHRSFKKYKDSGEYVFDVTYSIDKFGRRLTPVEDRNERNKFIIFVGGSFTFGAGVEDNETLPYQVGVLTKKFMPYNYGFHGWGPFDVLAKLENYDLKSQIKEDDGLMLYTFIDGHVRRTIGSMSIMRWLGKHAYYYVDKQGNFVRKGSFNTGRPVISFIYNVLRKSKILRKLRVDLPKINNHHIQLTAKAIGAIKNNFHQQFPKGQFYVIVKSGSKIGKQFMKNLDEMGIMNINMEGMFGKGGPKYHLAKEDSHPTPLAYRIMAKKIVKDLKLGDGL